MFRLVDGRNLSVILIEQALNSMNEQLDKYFLGELSDTEKKELLDQIESDSGHKAEFIRMQNTVTCLLYTSPSPRDS